MGVLSWIVLGATVGAEEGARHPSGDRPEHAARELGRPIGSAARLLRGLSDHVPLA
jgi:hypothetical protein